MIHTVEREATNNLIVKMLIEGKQHKEIANELGIGVGRVGDIAKDNNLERQSRGAGYITLDGKTLEDIRRQNPFKVGDKVKVKTKTVDDDGEKTAKCIVDQVTAFAVYARDSKGRMHCLTFAEIGIKEKVEDKKVG